MNADIEWVKLRKIKPHNIKNKQCLSGSEKNRQVNTISNHNYSLTKSDGILNIYYFKNNMEMENMDLSNR